MSEIRERRTQEQRRAATRGQILDAVVDSLLERGYAATTVAEVQQRAGLARGTLLHHFPARVDLMVGAIRHMADRRLEQFEREIAVLPPGTQRMSALVDLAWRDVNNPTFFAALELWVAARTDPELREAMIPVERELFAKVHKSLLGLTDDQDTGQSTDPRLPTLVEFTIDLLTGLAMSTILTKDPGSREVLLRRWKSALHVLMGQLAPDQLVRGRR